MDEAIKQILERTLNKMRQESDIEIVHRFNGNVKNTYFNLFLSRYLPAIQREFDKRGIDYSEIGDSRSLSFSKKVVLVDKKLILLHEN